MIYCVDNSKLQINTLIDHLFRQETGKLTAVLISIFGIANIQLAEDIVQETLLSALDHWSIGNVPDNPAAWLTQVAKRKAINELKRTQALNRITKNELDPNLDIITVENIFLKDEINDSQLRMILTCCQIGRAHV